MDAAQLDALVDSLTLAQQVSLLAGADNWETVAIPSAGIPAMRVSDGPAGARGTKFFVGPASVNVPSGTALAASWDPALIEQIGRILGRETRAKGARVLLAPTVNLHRTPVGGRNFECQSEDPFLSARITVGYVKGVQSEGVAACVKHFVGNDTEFERMSIDSQIDERTLREVYMRPFEAAVKEANALAIMTAYNRINGPFAADSKENLTDILRNEWGFDGIVMSDWFGLHSTVEGLEAGLDLEMPGPTRTRGDKLVKAVDEGKIDASYVRIAARRMLRFMDQIGAIADGGPGPETTRDEPSERATIRAAGAAGMVLLRNNENALPLLAERLKSVSVIGPNAARGRIMGGGSAMVNPVHEVHPLESISARLGAAGVEVKYAPGCTIFRTVPPPESHIVTNSRIEYFADAAALASGAAPAVVKPLERFHMMWPDEEVFGLDRKVFAARFVLTLTPDVTGDWQFGLSAAGESSLRINGELLFSDSEALPGGSFFGIGKAQVTANAHLEAGRPYEISVEYLPGVQTFLRGLIIGVAAPTPADSVGDATKIAATSDVSIVIVGTDNDWESEGYDRSSIELPGDQDRLVSEVAKVSLRTIVVVNAGSPVAMPWINEVDAVLFVWFPGQEFGDALVDVLLGDVDPGGRLPVTLPRRMEDTPAVEHHPGRNGVARYLEGRLMGYRWFDRTGREPLFPFGFGLSYASTVIESARISSANVITAVVKNTSDRAGQCVVQVYVHDVLEIDERIADEPEQQLVGFTKITLAAGEQRTVEIALDPRWAQHWDVKTHDWATRAGERELRVGLSSRDIAHKVKAAV
jgi:beta-glucosidase